MSAALDHTGLERPTVPTPLESALTGQGRSIAERNAEAARLDIPTAQRRGQWPMPAPQPHGYTERLTITSCEPVHAISAEVLRDLRAEHDYAIRLAAAHMGHQRSAASEMLRGIHLELACEELAKCAGIRAALDKAGRHAVALELFLAAAAVQAAVDCAAGRECVA
jgi:hypothetical protein